MNSALSRSLPSLRGNLARFESRNLSNWRFSILQFTLIFATPRLTTFSVLPFIRKRVPFFSGLPPIPSSESSKLSVAAPAQGSRHNRGCAVDLTLYDLMSGKPVEMPGADDEMSPRSFPDYPGGTSLQRWHRDLLRRAME